MFLTIACQYDAAVFLIKPKMAANAQMRRLNEFISRNGIKAKILPNPAYHVKQD